MVRLKATSHDTQSSKQGCILGKTGRQLGSTLLGMTWSQNIPLVPPETVNLFSAEMDVFIAS